MLVRFGLRLVLLLFQHLLNQVVDLELWAGPFFLGGRTFTGCLHALQQSDLRFLDGRSGGVLGIERQLLIGTGLDAHVGLVAVRTNVAGLVDNERPAALSDEGLLLLDLLADYISRGLIGLERELIGNRVFLLLNLFLDYLLGALSSGGVLVEQSRF